LGIKIYFSSDSDLTEYEAISKGYRHDVFVKINQSMYNVCIYTLNRLQQDFETEMESYDFFAIEPNIILVKESNKSEIIKAINKQYEQDYFKKIKSVDNINVDEFVKIQ